jgi:hypothetical protein
VVLRPFNSTLVMLDSRSEQGAKPKTVAAKPSPQDDDDIPF